MNVSVCRTVRLLSTWLKVSSTLKLNSFCSGLILLTSLGIEDQLLFSLTPNSWQTVVTINTNLLFPKTLNLLRLSLAAHGNCISIMSPRWGWALCAFAEHFETNIHESLFARVRCCYLRKVENISRNETVGIRIVGIRASHSAVRQMFEITQWDNKFKHVKLCALSFWRLPDVMQYLWSNSICYNSMHDVGFKSIGCNPCTRAVKRYESARAGRWWWEMKDRSSTECGLHVGQ
ncbi:MAG: phosphoadenosine phosphosulfate reductase family protein [Candidatus Hodgkinia cicadicola]